MRSSAAGSRTARSIWADEPAPGQGAAPEEGAPLTPAPSAAEGAARDSGGAVDRAPSADSISGEQLAEDLARAAKALGVALHEFVRPIAGQNHPGNYLRQLRVAKRPTPTTVERVRALIAGRNIDPGMPPQRVDRRDPASGNGIMRQRALETAAEQRARERELRQAAEMGKALRLPGETVADAVRREAEGIGERRGLARKIAGGSGDPLSLPRAIAHHPKARKFEPLPADLWAALKRLAEERGEAPMALLPVVVEQGIEALRRAA